MLSDQSRAFRLPTITLLLSIILTAPQPITAATSAKYCKSLGQTAAVPSLKEILGLNDREIDLLNGKIADVFRYPLGLPEKKVEKIIRKLHTLPYVQKQRLITELQQSSMLTHDFAVSNLMLALGDKSTWRRLIREIVESGYSPIHHFSVEGFWAKRVYEMAPETRAEIMGIVGEFYDKATSTSDGFSSAKRELDYLIHASIQGGEYIRSSIANGATPIEAYSNLLKMQNKAVGFKLSGRGGYSADVVLIALSQLQRKLRDHKISRLLIGGSFTAGRANLKTSDIDYMSDEGVLPKRVIEEMNLAINEALGHSGIHAKLHMSEFPGEIGTPRDRSYSNDLASSNPVLFMVYPKSIEMYVYQTRLWERGKSYKSVMTTPVIFRLDP